MKNFLLTLALGLSWGCSESNESGVSADYRSLRVNQITLSDRSGKPVISLSAESGANGAPVLLVRDPQGALLQIVKLSKEN